MVTEALLCPLAWHFVRCEIADMKHVIIRLADSQGAVLEERTVEGEYSTIDEYVAAMVAADGDERARERFEALLMEGLEGDATEWTDADWAELRRSIAEDR